MLSDVLRTVSVELPKGFEAQAKAFLDLLKEWNQRINLVSRKQTDEDLEAHLLASLAPLELFPKVEDRPAFDVSRGTMDLLDVGSGGGFPAIPLLLARPEWRGELVEATAKKCHFLREAAERLVPQRAEVVNARYEELEPEREVYGLITVRAVTIDPALATRARWQMLRQGFFAGHAPTAPEAQEAVRHALAEAGFEAVELRRVEWARCTLAIGRKP